MKQKGHRLKVPILLHTFHFTHPSYPIQTTHWIPTNMDSSFMPQHTTIEKMFLSGIVTMDPPELCTPTNCLVQLKATVSWTLDNGAKEVRWSAVLRFSTQLQDKDLHDGVSLQPPLDAQGALGHLQAASRALRDNMRMGVDSATTNDFKKGSLYPQGTCHLAVDNPTGSTVPVIFRLESISVSCD